jgi:hypothetical protein
MMSSKPAAWRWRYLRRRGMSSTSAAAAMIPCV